MEYFATCAGGRTRRKREKNVSIATSRRRRRRQKIIIRNDHPKEKAHTSLDVFVSFDQKSLFYHPTHTIRDATKTDDVSHRCVVLRILLLHRVARTSNVMSSWESYPMYTLKGISFVANASLFDISIFLFCCACFFVQKKTTTKNKKGDGRWSSKMRHRQRNS